MKTKTASRIARPALFAAVAALLLGAALIAVYLLSPVGRISIDVNPSIELTTNRLGKVASLTGLNEDGKTVLAGYRLVDRDLDDVIEDLVDRMIFFGFLGDGKANDVLITVEDESITNEQLQKVNDKVADYVAARNLTATVLSQGVRVDDSIRETAKEYQISAGKVELMNRILAGNQDVTAEELATLSVHDLLAFRQQNPEVFTGTTDYGVTDYKDTDYGPNNDGVTDYTDYNDTDYGPNNDGVTDYTDYIDTPYTNYADTPYTNYADTNYTDYGTTDYTDYN